MTTDNTNLNAKKDALRKQMGRAIAAAVLDERALWDEQIMVRLRAIIAEGSAASPILLVYAPLADEVDITTLIKDYFEQAVRVVMPKMQRDGALLLSEVRDFSDDLVANGPHGLREPRDGCPVVKASEVDIVLVPGRAFTREGRRLGRGGGCYDRLLATTQALSVGVAYDLQMLEELPCATHDQAVQVVVTQSEVFAAV